MLAACASVPAVAPVVRSPRPVEMFALDARIAVRQGEAHHYANIAWQHDARRDSILVTTPLGQGVAELSRDETGARLVTADRREIAAPDWEGLAERVLGARLPLNDMPQWLVGRPPAPSSGWQVEYLDYQSEAPDALPTLIELRRDDIEVRLKIDEWNRTQ
jgi:outer membrane lipoprotein LolB